MKTRLLVGLVLGLLLAGCMSWTPGWKAPLGSGGPPPAASPSAQPDRLFEEAGDEASLQQALRAYEAQLDERPGDYGILVRLSEIQILLGAAYSPSRKQKAAAYVAGIQHAERAMATHPELRRRVASGMTLGEAVDVLGPGEMKSMLLWVTGVSYYFKECLGGVGHVVNFRWMKRTQEVMEHMMEVEPSFEYGAVPFSLGIYYLGLPESVGGDLGRAEELIDEAVGLAEGHFLARWGRAKYLAVLTGDRETFESDLRWILAQDPRQAPSPYAWNVYMQRDAEAMLAEVERLFPQ